MTTLESTLGDLVTAHPSAAKIFHRYQLDYCCAGKRSLRQACVSIGLDPAKVLREVEGAVPAVREEIHWDTRSVEALIGHILDRYHAPLRAELPRLIQLARQVERAHGDKPERPVGLAALLGKVQEAVESHLAKEEQILFPLILSGRGAMAHVPIQVMEGEHQDHGQNLRRIRALAHDFQPPESACASWRELYRSLATLEAELMDHIHLENNILFPRTLAG